MTAMLRTLLLALLLAAIAAPAPAVDLPGLRGPVPLTEQPQPPQIPRMVNDDRRQPRNYPEQPPLIPHTIEGYAVTANANKCLTCHSRQFTAQSQAPMVSVTHFMDRDGQVLAAVSPRRYFCNQCHVPQYEVEPMIESRFVDVDQLLGRGAN